MISQSAFIILLRTYFSKTFELSSSVSVKFVLSSCSPCILSSAKPDLIQEMRDPKKALDQDLLESLDNQQSKVSVQCCSVA